jgi:outer membrane receptor protein involved in Fe transport
MKRAFAAVVVLVGVCLSANAEVISGERLRNSGAPDTATALSLHRPDVFSTVDGSVLIHSLPALALLDGRRLPVSDLGRMGWPTLDVVPLGFVNRVDVQKIGSSPRFGSDAPGGVVNLITKRYHTGGEVGMFYGRSGGKHGREDFSAYITGGIGNEYFNLTVGVAYHESEVRVPGR